jgi:hypothetical protein
MDAHSRSSLMLTSVTSTARPTFKHCSTHSSNSNRYLSHCNSTALCISILLHANSMQPAIINSQRQGFHPNSSDRRSSFHIPPPPSAPFSPAEQSAAHNPGGARVCDSQRQSIHPDRSNCSDRRSSFHIPPPPSALFSPAEQSAAHDPGGRYR